MQNMQHPKGNQTSNAGTPDPNTQEPSARKNGERQGGGSVDQGRVPGQLNQEREKDTAGHETAVESADE